MPPLNESNILSLAQHDIEMYNETRHAWKMLNFKLKNTFRTTIIFYKNDISTIVMHVWCRYNGFFVILI